MLMAFKPDGTIETQGVGDSSPAMRRCLATGETKAKEHMIRFVIGPELTVVTDVAGKLPGRGLWVCADRDALSLAISKNLFSRAAKMKLRVPDGLLDMVETLLAKRCLDLLGLAKSAGIVVTGQPQIEQALSQGKLSYILLAADAGRDCRKKLSRARLAASGFARDALGAALGHDHLASAGVKPHALADKLEKECARWQGVRPAHNMTATDEELDNERS